MYEPSADPRIEVKRSIARVVILFDVLIQSRTTEEIEDVESRSRAALGQKRRQCLVQHGSDRIVRLVVRSEDGRNST